MCTGQVGTLEKEKVMTPERCPVVLLFHLQIQEDEGSRLGAPGMGASQASSCRVAAISPQFRMGLQIIPKDLEARELQ